MRAIVYLVAGLAVATNAFAGGGGSADLRLSLQDGPDPVAPTQNLRYSLVVQNGGPDVAVDVLATVTLPPGVVFKDAANGCFVVGASTVSCARATLAANTELSVGTVDAAAPPGLPGPLTATATVSAATSDPDPTSNVADTVTQTAPGLRILAPPVLEGDAGLRDAGIVVELLPDGSALPSAVTVDWQTAPGNATAPEDYVASAGTLTFSAATTLHQLPIGIVGDTTPEVAEVFFILLTNAQGAVAIPNVFGPLIVNDDGPAGASAELSHGTTSVSDLRSGAGPAPPERLYRVVVPARSSMEVTVDALSGDLLPIALDRLGPSGNVVQSADVTGTGGSKSLRWSNVDAIPNADQSVRISSGGCIADCGADDGYRIRAYDTTARIARFNNTATQLTVLLLQNATAPPVVGTVSFWDAGGDWIGDTHFVIAGHGTAVVNTNLFAEGRSGSITIRHDAPYGLLQGKAVSIEPASGFSFDAPLAYRPR
jgi:uncharacterized repeat protein (TIGR01451 family)